jgi:squalene-hopene/tetraprenyl-beta-curcumene cyclase
MSIRRLSVLALALFVLGCGKETSAPVAPTPPSVAPAHSSVEPDPPGTATWKDRAKAAADRGVRFLREKQEGDGWKFSAKAPTPDIGITSLCLLAMLESPRKYRETDGPFIAKPLAWLAASQQKDGSIHGGMLATYNTSVAVLALAGSGNDAFKPILAKAGDYLRVVQSDESDGYQSGDRYYGGVGYGGDERPDMSNTQFAVEAAVAAGVPKNDPFFKKAATFATRSQNLSETNDLKDKEPAVGNDGGGYYAPGVTANEAKAGFVTLSDGRKIRKSYGSMSYALLKTYVFRDIERRDPRVKALLEWMGKNYSVVENPGMRQEGKALSEKTGLFYYYLTMARALGAAGDGALVGADGKPIAWKEDLARQLVALQRPDGSWASENAEFWENSPVLATAMALNALNAGLK